MKNIFNPDSVFIQFLSRVGDLILTNALFLLCSLPVVTMGASLAAMHKITQDLVFENEGGIWKTFWRAFKENFRQATIVWVAALVIIVSLVCDWLLIMTYFEGTLATVMYVLLLLLVVIVACVMAYMIPLMVRYNNTLREHLSNAVVLAIIKLPKTVGMVLLNLLPLIILMLSIPVFVQTLIFWIFIGFAFTTFLESHMLKGIFEELEKGQESVTVFK